MNDQSRIATFWDSISNPRVERWLVVIAILLFFFLALDSLVDDSPTFDEPFHVGFGLGSVKLRDPRLSIDHPPLVDSLGALPLLTMPEINFSTDDPRWDRDPDRYNNLGFTFYIFRLNLEHVERIYFLARLPIVFLTIGLALAGWHFAREMWRRPVSLFVFLMLLFDPNIIAHGRYITTDLGVALFAFLATYLLWRLWRSAGWNWKRQLWVALGIGLAFSSKYSAVSFIPIWIILAVLPIYGKSSPASIVDYLGKAGRRVGQLLIAGLLALPVIWAIHLFEWRSFVFYHTNLQAINYLWRGPMPTFWAGLARMYDYSTVGRSAYLLGEVSPNGFPHYFIVATLVKTPALTLLLFGLAAVLLVVIKASRARALFLLVPALLFLGSTLLSKINIGYRHLLPMLPFIYMLIGGLAGKSTWSWFSQRWKGSHKLAFAPATAVLLLIGSLILIDVWIHPHYLNYFNLASGGPSNGHKILLDSNVDWGQDLKRLRNWIDDNEIDHIKLSLFGHNIYSFLDASFEELPSGRKKLAELHEDPYFDPDNPEPGIYAISANNLYEMWFEDREVFTWFSQREPDGRIGYSIFIYEVP